MAKKRTEPLYRLAAGLLGGWFFLKYGLPVLIPFLLAAALALAAEPLVSVLDRRLRLPRFLAAGIGVTAVFVILLTVLIMLLALLLRQAGNLSRVMPDLVASTQHGLNSLEGWLLELSHRTPAGVRPVLEGAVTNLFSGSGATMDRFTDGLIGLAGGVLGWLTDSALTFATGVLAAFMTSARLPAIKSWLRQRLPRVWQEKYLPALRGLKDTLLGWLSAQLKLSGITLLLLLAGFWILRIPYGVVWAGVVALVDAIPVLGTGTVLIPWSLICMLQGETARGAGLLGLYAVVWLVRSILEPRLLGKELGLDPLVTLVAIYAGYKLMGLLGMILFPLLAVAVLRLLRSVDAQ